MTAQNELRPFHETVVDAFRKCDGGGAFQALIELVITTKVPRGHDEIILAIDECIPRLDPLGMETWSKLAEQAKESLLARKPADEKEESTRQRLAGQLQRLADGVKAINALR